LNFAVFPSPSGPDCFSTSSPAAVQAAQLEEAGTEARLNAPGSDIPPDPGAIGPDSGDGGEPTTKNPFTTTFWKQNPLGLGGHGDHGHHGNHDGAADHEASAPTTTADGDRAADATPASNGTVPASVDAGVSDDALALNDPDAAEAQSDESDSEADEDRDKTAPNGKGARGKKRAKSS